MSESKQISQIPNLKASSFLALYDQIDPDTQTKEIIPRIMSKRYVYILFDCNQGGNIDDVSYGLDRMFHGIYLSYYDAFLTFLNLILKSLDKNNDAEVIKKLKELPLNSMNEEEMDEILFEEFNWRVISCKLN